MEDRCRRVRHAVSSGILRYSLADLKREAGRSLDRAVLNSGVRPERVPGFGNGTGLTADDIRQVLAWCRANGRLELAACIEDILADVEKVEHRTDHLSMGFLQEMLDDFECRVNVCDSIMGSGKTQALISTINACRNPDIRWIVVTPYLEETERIARSCPAACFRHPKQKSGSGKYVNLRELVLAEENIVMTHALFGMFERDVVKLIADSRRFYILAMDEAFEVCRYTPAKAVDIADMRRLGYLEETTDGYAQFVAGDDYDGAFKRYRNVLNAAYGEISDDGVISWMYPKEVFSAFRRVIVMTYMFDRQVLKSYFDFYGIRYAEAGVEEHAGGYEFTRHRSVPDGIRRIPDLVTVYGPWDCSDSAGAFSQDWYSRNVRRKVYGKYRFGPVLNDLRRETCRFFAEHADDPSDVVWTVPKSYIDLFDSTKYESADHCLAWNAKAVNGWSDRHVAAYLVNPYMNVAQCAMLNRKGIRASQDDYALNCIVQWLWRTAVRNFEPVSVFVPSRRMHRLLTEWLDTLR